MRGQHAGIEVFLRALILMRQRGVIARNAGGNPGARLRLFGVVVSCCVQLLFVFEVDMGEVVNVLVAFAVIVFVVRWATSGASRSIVRPNLN